MTDLTRPEITFFVIVVVAVALLITERLRNDVVGVLIVVALAVTDLLSRTRRWPVSRASPPGLSDVMRGLIGRLAGKSLTRVLAVIMPSVGLRSAFTHHVTTTAVMLPVTLTLSRERNRAPSKLLMLLSFAASLGTTITIIGAPAFLIASALLQQAGRPGLGIFSIAPIGLALTAAGTLFMVVVGRVLLPERKGADEGGSRFRLDEYFTELSVRPESSLVGRTVEDIERDDRYHVDVVGLVRGGRSRRRPHGMRVEAGDVLFVRTTPEQLATIRQERDVELHPVTPGFLMMVLFHGEARRRRRAPVAGLVMLGTIVLAAVDAVPIEIAAVAGAVAMVLTGCLTPTQAYRAIDARIYVFIAGAIPLGAAMEKSGASERLAGWLQGVVGDWSELAVLLAVFAVVAVITQFMSDSATTALFGPVAIALASALGRPPDAFVVTVAMASVVAFLTPIGHHGNLLI